MMKEGSKNGAKMASKVNEEINAICDSKKIGFWSQNDPKTEPKWRLKSRKFVDISGYPPKTSPRWPNELQNGAKIDPKGSQMERTWSSKRAKIEKKNREK